MGKTINMMETVSLDLAPYGRRILSRYMRDAAEAELLPTPTPTSVDMPLWEVFKVFGRHAVSSALLPFEEVSAIGDTLEQRQAKITGERLTACHSLIADIAQALRLPVDHGVLRSWAGGASSPTPHREGYWWLGDRVVQVAEERGGLVVILGNGRRKPIVDFDGWGGPALRDPRLVTPDEREDDDIPF